MLSWNYYLGQHFDLIITHNPSGEYTRHIRHEEVGKAVIKLWQKRNLYLPVNSGLFAYADGNKKYNPLPDENASIYHQLTKHIWLRKYRIMTETYGFRKVTVGKP